MVTFFFFRASCSNQCLAALDLGADVEQPFDCLIVQNRQATQSMGKVDGLDTGGQHGWYLISSSDNNNIRGGAQWTDHQWNAEWADNPTRLRIFIPDTDTHPGSALSASAPVSDVSALACTNGVWSPLRPVSVAQKNKPSTMLSSYVQSIDFSMDCMAWRFWTMRQPNGCSTPALRSSAAKKWFEQLAQKKNRH